MPQDKKKKFSSFTKAQSFQVIGLDNLIPWAIQVAALDPSPFFEERLQRLQRQFDLETYEESKKLLIDAICEEATVSLSQLKIWKGAKLEGDVAAGYVDYLVTERKSYLTPPLLCIIEAKRDDFEKGLAQCLIEMHACLVVNLQVGRSIDIFGIVTNGGTWRFYRMTPQRQVYESPPYSTGDMPLLLGRLHHIFQLCETNLQDVTK